MFSSTVPTSWGYETEENRNKMNAPYYFSKLFDKISTTDNTPYCCIPAALEFRARVCSGETSIRDYCEDIARQGGDVMAEILGTEVLGASSASFRQCCFVNVRLPLTLADLNVDTSVGRGIAKWMQELTPAEYETYIPIKFYAEIGKIVDDMKKESSKALCHLVLVRGPNLGDETMGLQEVVK
ncbi:uncharacterized protein N0V96_011274 [Colletotrichum fioriniae]|uniref:uncharacterized protein n=1 Tax=Colletotrichum fioriniae TaxID=710243 RepID=UPI0032DBAF28|nr:hypothetical protein N0V96_011274 [Colletotrichum fioriniae]